jgi:hypothetical protein
MVVKLLVINILTKNISNNFLFMSILAQFPCSNGGLRPSARLKKVFRAGRATPTTQIYFSITPSQKKSQKNLSRF